jgi:hypothetical protein
MARPPSGRKAAAIRRLESVAGWLHGVAHRIAVKLRAAAAVRQHGQAPPAPSPWSLPLGRGYNTPVFAPTYEPAWASTRLGDGADGDGTKCF